jgi:putative ABC transport system permease protein
MLKNYITSIWRYVARNRSFTSINILGLVIGMTAFMLIAQYVLHELNYDTFWANSKNVYRVQQDRYDKGELSTRWAAGAQGVGPDMKATFPEVTAFVRLTPSNALLSHGDTFFKEEGVYYASKDFFTVFGYPLLEGVDTSALSQPNQMVLSQTLAKKYFGNESPLGKTMRNNGDVEYVVTGVFKDLPENTHMKVTALLSFATFAKLVGRKSEAELDAWQWDGFLTYVSLDPKTNVKALEAKFPAFVQKEAGEELKKYNA